MNEIETHPVQARHTPIKVPCEVSDPEATHDLENGGWYKWVEMTKEEVDDKLSAEDLKDLGKQQPKQPLTLLADPMAISAATSSGYSIEVSEHGRPIIWLVKWSWFGGKCYGFAHYVSKKEALKAAIWYAMGDADWEKFPDHAHGHYPYDDRDWKEGQPLSPPFRIRWNSNGGGKVEVYKIEVMADFQAANIDKVTEIYERIYG
jgi:hypothetical protein